MPRNQRDILMCRKDAIYNPDKTTKSKPTMSARQIKRLVERDAKKKTK